MERNNLRFRDLIKSLSYEELLKVKYDVENGSIHLRQLVNQTLHELENEHKVYCAGCGQQIDANSITTQTLVFGPHDFKKKATFCAQDCLEYFLNEMKTSKERKLSERNENF